MKRYPRKKKFNEVSIAEGTFFSTVRLEPEDIEESDSMLADIEMLRVGEFKHKMYGDLDITDEMLDSMVENFDNGIIGREVSFDWNHEAKAASGWLKELRVEDGILIGTAELTTEGKESIINKKYGYFSVEYSDDYEDSESGDKFGPTVLGGALTNRPFISKLKKIEFSLDGDEEISIYRLKTKEETNMKKKVKRDPVKKTGDEEVTLESLKEENAKLQEEKDELLEFKKTEEKRLKELEESQQPEDKKLSAFILQQKKQMTELRKEIDGLKGANKELKEETVKSIDARRQLEIDRVCDKLMTEDHHHPSVVEVVRQVIRSDINGEKVIKFQETIGEGDDVETIDLEFSIQEAVLRILETIPKTQRANYKEDTSSDTGVSLTEEEQTNMENGAIKRAFGKKGLKLVASK